MLANNMKLRSNVNADLDTGVSGTASHLRIMDQNWTKGRSNDFFNLKSSAVSSIPLDDQKQDGLGKSIMEYNSNNSINNNLRDLNKFLNKNKQGMSENVTQNHLTSSQIRQQHLKLMNSRQVGYRGVKNSTPHSTQNMGHIFHKGFIQPQQLAEKIEPLTQE